MTLVLRSTMYFLELGLEPLFEVGHRHQSAEHAVRLGFLATGHGFSVHALGFQRRVVGFMCLLACPPAVPVERVLGEHKKSETQSGVRPAFKSNPLIPNIFLIFGRQMPDRTRRWILLSLPALKYRQSCVDASGTSQEGQLRLYLGTQGSTPRPLWRVVMDSFKDSRGGSCGLHSTRERAQSVVRDDVSVFAMPSSGASIMERGISQAVPYVPGLFDLSSGYRYCDTGPLAPRVIRDSVS